MIYCLPGVLTRDELQSVRQVVASAAFVDGKSTTGSRARRVKNNRQVPRDAPGANAIAELMERSLRRHRLFNWAVWPKRFGGILISRYDPGMEYGNHVDNAIFGTTDPMRTDVSFTVFLSDPLEYDGGELTIESALGSQEIKLAAGEAVVYPSSTLHRVAQVTRGCRFVAVGWVECLVRDPARREILYDLERIKRLMADKLPDASETDWAYKTQANLLRMWAEP